MRRGDSARFIQLVGLAAWAASCAGGKAQPAPAGDADTGYALLTDQELGWFSSDLPTAARKQALTIPDALLTSDDITYENNVILAIYDADGNLVGYVRDIFTHVACSGACQAIRFMLVYDANARFLDVFHPVGTTYDLMKYWQGLHVAFTDQDRAQLKSILMSPPAELAAVTNPSTLVADSSATAPTVAAYQTEVVRGAAFTSYSTLMYRLDTVDLIAAITGT